MRKVNKKQGFTLVELLVVIAILAILASVSVIGYTGFTKKAQNSNDEVLVAQMNTALKGEQATHKPETMGEVLDVLFDAGFVVENLTPTYAKNNILWNSSKNEMVIVKDGDLLSSTPNPAMWIIAKDEEELNRVTEKYSVYLADGFTEKSEADNLVNVKNGCDTGKNAMNVSYTDTVVEDVVFRTNNGNLTVNNENANVKHYGKLVNLDVQAVASSSYHEFGHVTGKVVLTKGNFVPEKEAKLNVVKVESNEVTIDLSKTEKPEETVVVLAETVKKNTVMPNAPQEVEVVEQTSSAKAYSSTTKQNYDTFKEAFEATEKDGIIYLLNNEDSLTEEFLVDRNLTLELNGFKLTFNSNISFNVQEGVELFAIKNGSIENTKIVVEADNNTSMVKLENARLKTSNQYFTIELKKKASLEVGVNSYVINTFASGCGIWYSDNTKINLYGNVESSGWYGITGCGTDVQSTLLNIYDTATVKCTSNDAAGIYIPQNGTFNMYGGYVSGPNGIVIKSGNVNIVGGTIEAKNNYAPFVHSGNGVNPNGDALSIDACNYPGGNPLHVNVENVKLIVADKKCQTYVLYYNHSSAKPVINFTGIEHVELTY